MKRLVFLSLLIGMGCGGSLSDEQRKQLRNGMEEQQIVKLSDSEIVTASLDRGRAIFEALEGVKFSPAKVDSIGRAYQVKLHWIVPGSGDALEIENQVIEAYVIGAETGSMQDNIQKLRSAPEAMDYDSLMYSRPVVTSMADGAVNVEGVWNIYLAKKDVILYESKRK
jgi:hypothetical protein